MEKTTRRSVKLAKSLGYEERPLSTAHKGIAYVKNGKKWIHDIYTLKSSLGGVGDDYLERNGYDVDAYFRYNKELNSTFDSQLMSLYAELSAGDGEPVHLCEGVYLTSEGKMLENP